MIDALKRGRRLAHHLGVPVLRLLASDGRPRPDPITAAPATSSPSRGPTASWWSTCTPGQIPGPSSTSLRPPTGGGHCSPSHLATTLDRASAATVFSSPYASCRNPPAG